MAWKAGLARIAITPTTDVWLAGYGSKRAPTDTIHDLLAEALALQDPDGTQAVLVTSDLMGVPRGMYETIVARCRERFGLSQAQVMITFSHNHCGPRLRGDLVDYYPEDSTQERLVAEYTDDLTKRLVALIGAALADLAPARLVQHEGEATFAVNRRNNPEGEVPALRAAGKPLKGPVDHRVPILTVHRDEDRLDALLFGYACHPTTLAFTSWCGDYPGFAKRELEERFPGAIPMFVNTCGGDQNPLPRRELSLCRTYGHRLAEAVIEGVGTQGKPVSADLAVAFEYVDLAYDKVMTRADLEAGVDSANAIHARWAKRLLSRMDKGERFQDSYPYPVHVWRFGSETLFIGLGAEAVVDYALRFTKELGPRTWVCGYASDLVAYIPSRRVWEEGGYEGGPHLDEYGRPALRWAGDVEQRVVDTVHRLVEKVQP